MTERESLCDARRAVYGDLADRYLALEPADRYEVTLEVVGGERCPHGYPDQGEGCEACDA